MQPGEEVWWGGGRIGKEKREKEELRGFFSKRTHHLLKGGDYLVQLFCPSERVNRKIHREGNQIVQQ